MKNTFGVFRSVGNSKHLRYMQLSVLKSLPATTIILVEFTKNNLFND